MNLRRFGWAVVILSAGLLLLILYVNQQKAQRKPAGKPGDDKAAVATTAPTTRQIATTKPAADTSAEKTEPAAPAPEIRSAPDSTPAPPEWRITRDPNPRKFLIGSFDLEKTGYTFQVETRSRGAAINTVKLSAYFASVEDKRLHDRQPDRYDAIRAANPGKYKGRYSLLNPVELDGKRYLPLATRSISITVPGREEPVYYRLDNKPWWREPETADDRTDESESIRFSWTLLRNANHADPGKKPDYRKFLTVYKTYTVRRKDYRIGVSLEVENHSSLELKVAMDQSGPVGIPLEDTRGDSRKFFYAKLRNEGQKIQPSSHDRGDLGKMELAETEDVGTSHASEPVLWIGETNKFFGAMMYLIPREKGRLQAAAYQAKFYYAAIEETPTSRTFLTGVRIPELLLKKGKSAKVAFDMFAGPKRRDMFVNADDEYYREQYDELEYIKTIEFGGCFCSFSWLSLAMMWMLQKLSLVAIGNFGVAIILLVILVRLCLHPLTKKGQVSMMKMQKLAPAMKKLEEKYKDDKEALNKEKMRLFKEGGAGQFLGCLPMFLQMPIWIALWTGINAAIELRHSAFLPVWITDLAAPDAVISWPAITVPLLGWEIVSLNLLPLLLTVAMFLQAKLNPSMTGQTGAATTPEAQKQQKMMRIMMPVMMLLIFYKAPSGLTLYIMTSTFFGVAEQYVIRKHIREKEATEAALETTVRVSGKGPRASRPKKPKGPFWTKKG